MLSGADTPERDRGAHAGPATRTGVFVVAVKSGGRTTFGLATVNVRFR